MQILVVDNFVVPGLTGVQRGRGFRNLLAGGEFVIAGLAEASEASRAP
ncbi:MAG: hypothetical protein WBN57_13710 [Gammaproteobacteria bacterium]